MWLPARVVLLRAPLRVCIRGTAKRQAVGFGDSPWCVQSLVSGSGTADQGDRVATQRIAHIPVHASQDHVQRIVQSLHHRVAHNIASMHQRHVKDYSTLISSSSPIEASLRSRFESPVKG